MSALGRWLDPPEQIARKRALRAARGSGHSGEDRQFEIGCLVPIGFALAVVLGLGVLIGTAWHQAPPAPREQLVRVIDDGAPGGPQVIATAVVRWP